jgi:CRP/FNR family transcriptional regulator, cyclic AMP receptor protein
MADLGLPAGPAGGFLAALGPGERATLATIGRWRSYRRGDLLFLEGERSDDVYLVVEGRARVFITTAAGNEVTLSVRGPGDLVGEMAALDPVAPRSATVVALAVLRCRVIRAAELIEFLEGQPRAALALLHLVIGRLRDSDRRRAEFGSYDATRRLARILVEAAASAPTAVPGGGLALSQQELAGLIGASRESVGRALAELRRLGLVSTGRRTITVHDPAALRLYAG